MLFRSRGATIAFALKPKAVPFTHKVILGPGDGPSLLKKAPEIKVGESTVDGYVVRWTGDLRMPLPIARDLELALPCEVSRSWLTRYPSPQPTGVAEDGVALRGVTGEMRVVARGATEARQCVEAIVVQ